MADMYAVKKETLDNIANAIRTKRDITDGISVDDMAMQIGLISGEIGDFTDYEEIKAIFPNAKSTNNWTDGAIVSLKNNPKVILFSCADDSKPYLQNGLIRCGGIFHTFGLGNCAGVNLSSGVYFSGGILISETHKAAVYRIVDNTLQITRNGANLYWDNETEYIFKVYY